MPNAASRLAVAADVPPAVPVSAAAIAAFRTLLGGAAIRSHAVPPGGFRADVTGLALAAMARAFDFDAGVIALLDHAQFERCPVEVTPRRDGTATLVCARYSPDGFRPARQPPAR